MDEKTVDKILKQLLWIVAYSKEANRSGRDITTQSRTMVANRVVDRFEERFSEKKELENR